MLSDTHGDLTKVRHISKIVENIDMVVHCGDGFDDGIEIKEIFKVPTVAVGGNCDERGDNYQVVELGQVRLFITHGHEYNVNYTLGPVMYAAMENQCDVACFGHTHLPACEKVEDVLILNPGSLSRPKDGTGGSYGIIIIKDGDVTGHVVYYDTVIAGADGEKVKETGKISQLLNYSDRF